VKEAANDGAVARNALLRLGDHVEAEYERTKVRLEARVRTDGAWQARSDVEAFIRATEQLVEARTRPDEIEQRAPLIAEGRAWKARVAELEKLIGETRGVLGSMILTCEGTPMEEDRPHMAKLARGLADKFKAALELRLSVTG